MAHEIEGNYAFFASGKPAWHGLGTVLTDAPSVDEAWRLAYPHALIETGLEAVIGEPTPPPVAYPDRALITYDDTPAVTSGEAEQVAEVAIDAATVSPEWTRYRSQVDALLHSTGMTPADLMIHAIDYLYRHTIAQ